MIGPFSYDRPIETLVHKNKFRQHDYEPLSAPDLPSFDDFQTQLPIPILPGYDAWERMYWRAWEQAWGNIHFPVPASKLTDGFVNTPNNDHLFMWDSAFMTIFGVYGRRAFDFIGTLNNFYARQHADGFICREIDIQSGSDLYEPFNPDSVGPNILPWAEWQYYRATGDEERLRDVFYALMALYRWYRHNRTWRNGLYWATGMSSGMDNQSRFPVGRHHHGHWSWVDASLQASVATLALQRMALVLEENEMVQELGADRNRLQATINSHLWNPREYFYQDLDRDGRFSTAKSIAAYWALHDRELIPENRREPFIRHLRERYVFFTRHPIPALSADSPDYSAYGQRWRGGVWSATNYVVLRGLRIFDEHKLAYDLALQHLDHVSRVFDRTGQFWEYYAPEAADKGVDARPNYVGWTGLSPITILLENVLGISTDWRLRRVFWDRRLQCTGHYGVQNYPLGPHSTVDLIGDDEMIFITTDVPFTLYLRDPNLTLQTAVSPGTTEISLK